MCYFFLKAQNTPFFSFPTTITEYKKDMFAFLLEHKPMENKRAHSESIPSRKHQEKGGGYRQQQSVQNRTAPDEQTLQDLLEGINCFYTLPFSPYIFSSLTWTQRSQHPLQLIAFTVHLSLSWVLGVCSTRHFLLLYFCYSQVLLILVWNVL